MSRWAVNYVAVYVRFLVFSVKYISSVSSLITSRRRGILSFAYFAVFVALLLIFTLCVAEMLNAVDQIRPLRLCVHISQIFLCCRRASGDAIC